MLYKNNAVNNENKNRISLSLFKNKHTLQFPKFKLLKMLIDNNDLLYQCSSKGSQNHLGKMLHKP